MVPMKLKHQYHLSQWGECVYSALSWKKRRLLRESMVVQIVEQPLILKMVEREFFFTKPKHEYQLSQWGEYVYDA